MKFDFNDFIELDTNRLLEVNGGATCSGLSNEDVSNKIIEGTNSDDIGRQYVIIEPDSIQEKNMWICGTPLCEFPHFIPHIASYCTTVSSSSPANIGGYCGYVYIPS